MIMCQVSLYPRGVSNRQGIVDEVVERLKYHEVEYEAAKFSISVYGQEDDVWSAVQDLFKSVRELCGHSMLQAVFLEENNPKQAIV